MRIYFKCATCGFKTCELYTAWIHAQNPHHIVVIVFDHEDKPLDYQVKELKMRGELNP